MQGSRSSALGEMDRSIVTDQEADRQTLAEAVEAEELPDADSNAMSAVPERDSSDRFSKPARHEGPIQRSPLQGPR